MQTHTASKEWQFVFYCCQYLIQPESAGTPPDTTQDFDWERVYQIAGYHRVRPQVYGVMVRREEWQVPDIIIDSFKWDSQQLTLHYLSCSRELAHILGLLEQEGIPVMPYKGTLLSQMAYPQGWSRETADIDLLIRDQDYYKVKNIFLADGYEWTMPVPEWLEKEQLAYLCENSWMKKRKNKKINIDLHWKLGTPARQLDFILEDLLPVSTPDTLLNKKIQALSPEGLFFTTCLHHIAKDRSLKIRNLVDLAAILIKHQDIMDWPLLLQFSEKLKIKRIMLIGLALVNRHFDVKLPVKILALIERGSIKKRLGLFYDKLLLEKTLQRTTLIRQANDIIEHLYLREHFSTRRKIITSFVWLVIRPNTHDIKNSSEGKKYSFLHTIRKLFRLVRTHFSQKKQLK